MPGVNLTSTYCRRICNSMCLGATEYTTSWIAQWKTKLKLELPPSFAFDQDLVCQHESVSALRNILF